MTTKPKPEQSQIMAARLKLKLEERLGVESEQWARDLAAQPLPRDRNRRTARGRTPHTAAHH